MREVQLEPSKKFEGFLDAPCITPDLFSGKTIDGLSKLKIWHGKRESRLGEYFKIKGESGSTPEETRIVLKTSEFKIKHVGEGMTAGEIHVEGSAGIHLGAGMTGGRITVKGDVDDYCGSEMRGGVIQIEGNAGNFLGSSYPGSPYGMYGGRIIVTGNTGESTGAFMRRGVIYIGGGTGSFTGTHMSAGTVIIKGILGPRAGASMTRGVILCLGTSSDLLPSFVYDCTANFEFIRIYLKTLKDQIRLSFEPQEITGPYIKFSGDRAEKDARGEIFLIASKNQNLIPKKE